MLIYTFSSFPYIEQLSELSGDVFVFSNKLREDLKVLKEHIASDEPDYILGIAKSRGRSRYEPIAINRFHRGMVMKDFPDQLELYVPGAEQRAFPISTFASDTFCNWTMYHVQTHIAGQGLNTKLSFLHLNPKDIGVLLTQLSCATPHFA